MRCGCVLKYVLSRFLSFGCRWTRDLRYLGFPSSVIGAQLRLLSKQTLKILTTRWNLGLLASLNHGVKMMRSVILVIFSRALLKSMFGTS
jgi:hypothetical protein